jgi:hypothetical protein
MRQKRRNVIRKQVYIIGFSVCTAKGKKGRGVKTTDKGKNAAENKPN